MKIKKFDKKENETQEISFSAKSLEKNKDEKTSIKTSIDDQEKIEKEFKKNLDKVEKFKEVLDTFKIPTLIRIAKGDDVLAACGQLNSKN